MPWMHAAILFRVSYANPASCSGPPPHLALEELPAWLGGGSIPFLLGDSLTVHNNNDISNNKLKGLEPDTVLLSLRPGPGRNLWQPRASRTQFVSLLYLQSMQLLPCEKTMATSSQGERKTG